MKKLNVAEMRTVEGGATFSRKCNICGKTYSRTYKKWDIIGGIATKLAVLKQVAVCQSKHRMGL